MKVSSLIKILIYYIYIIIKFVINFKRRTKLVILIKIRTKLRLSEL